MRTSCVGTSWLLPNLVACPSTTRGERAGRPWSGREQLRTTGEGGLPESEMACGRREGGTRLRVIWWSMVASDRMRCLGWALQVKLVRRDGRGCELSL